LKIKLFPLCISDDLLQGIVQTPDLLLETALHTTNTPHPRVPHPLGAKNKAQTPLKESGMIASECAFGDSDAAACKTQRWHESMYIRCSFPATYPK